MELKIDKNIFNEIYLPSILNYDNRYEVYYGGAGSGKSHFVAQKVVIKALRDKRKILVVRKVGRTIKQSVFQLLLDTLSFFHILEYCKVNRTDFTITLPNGSIFLCSGLDDVEKLKSIVGITDLWIEEATELFQDDFDQLNLRLRHPTATGQQIFLSFNPVSKVNWCYLLFFSGDKISEELIEFRKKVKIIKSTYENNKFLPNEYIESLKNLKVTNPDYYRIYALGEFGSLGKLVYTHWRTEYFNHTEIKGTLLVGLDFGFVNDTTALICSILDEENKKIYIFDEWGDTNKINNEIAQVIKDKGLSKSIIIADSAEQKSIEEIKRTGIARIKACVKGQGSILQGIQKLQQYELIVHPNCLKTIEELKNYSWKKDRKTNEYINEPEDKHNHYLDALRYSLQCVSSTQKLNTINKSILF